MRLILAGMVLLLSLGCWSPFYVSPGNTQLLTYQEKLTAALDASFRNAGLFARLSNKKVFVEVRTLADTELPGPTAEFLKSYIIKQILKNAPNCAVLAERGGENVVVSVLVRAFGVEATPFLLGPVSLLFYMVRYRAVCELTVYAYDLAGNYKIQPTTLPKGEITWSRFLVLGFGPF